MISCLLERDSVSPENPSIANCEANRITSSFCIAEGDKIGDRVKVSFTTISALVGGVVDTTMVGIDEGEPV